jgi:biotin operon repressor
VKPHAISRTAAARLLWMLRRRSLGGRALSEALGLRLRGVGEHVEFLRLRGHRINGTAEGGYSLARSRKGVSLTIRQLWSRVAKLRRVALAMERGHVPQARLIRERRAS